MMLQNGNASLDEYWDAIVNFMDDEIREEVHAELSPCTNEDFLERYMELHEGFEEMLESEFGLVR